MFSDGWTGPVLETKKKMLDSVRVASLCIAVSHDGAKERVLYIQVVCSRAAKKMVWILNVLFADRTSI